MDEAFLRRALQAMGEENIVSIKVMKNKMTGENANYGFINFENDYSALLAMHKLNSKVIPETNPVRAFFASLKFLVVLNLISLELSKDIQNECLFFGQIRREHAPICNRITDYSMFSINFSRSDLS